LAIRGARTLIGASAASEIGNWLYNAALLGYVYSATRSAGWVGAATVCRLVPYVLLRPFGGAVADRYRRRTVLLAGDAPPRRWTRRCSAWKAARCSTLWRRHQACGPRWISAAPHLE